MTSTSPNFTEIPASAVTIIADFLYPYFQSTTASRRTCIHTTTTSKRMFNFMMASVCKDLYYCIMNRLISSKIPCDDVKHEVICEGISSQVVIDVIAGLSLLHSIDIGLVHGDVKPANVVVSDNRAKDGGRVLLLSTVTKMRSNNGSTSTWTKFPRIGVGDRHIVRATWPQRETIHELAQVHILAPFI